MSEIRTEEGVRSWYDRTTKRTRKALAFATMVSAALAVTVFMIAPPSFIAAAQIFNGAITIPAAGAIWIAAFLYMYLIPGREVSFRSQESLERTEQRVQNVIEQELVPAIRTWKALGDKVLAQVNSGMLNEIRATASEVRTLAHGLDARLKVIEEQVKPAIQDLRDMARDVKGLTGSQPAAPDTKSSPINFERALSAVRKRREPQNHGITG